MKLKNSLLENEEKLTLYTNAIAKVHKGNHPEVHEVKELYQTLLSEVKSSPIALPNLTETFDRLVAVTNHFEIPNDVCETIEAVYQDLAQADKLYRQGQIA